MKALKFLCTMFLVVAIFSCGGNTDFAEFQMSKDTEN